MSARGDDPDTLPLTYAAMIKRRSSDIPSDMTITMHLCRGNFRSNFVASGGYEPVAEILFNTINVHGYFMEYDCERAGGFEPLRFLPKGKTVVLGLVTSKTGQLESRGHDPAPHRGGGEVRAARSACAVAAMRLRLDRGRQYAGRGRAMGEAAHDRGDRRGGVGKTHETHQAALPRRPCRQPAAPGRAQGSAREARQGRDSTTTPEGGRGSRRSSASSASRRRSACSRSPTASSAARGGISISSGASKASSAT